MTDPTQQGQPTEEELRAYLQQVREAEPAAIVVQAYRMLGEGAEIKLGRVDARLLIDAMSAVVDAVEAGMPDELVAQMREGVRQLQTAQVQAEAQEGGAGAAAGADEGGEAAGAAGSGAPPAAPQPGQAPQPGAPQPGAPQGEENLTNRLWIPGREPGR